MVFLWTWHSVYGRTPSPILGIVSRFGSAPRDIASYLASAAGISSNVTRTMRLSFNQSSTKEEGLSRFYGPIDEIQ
jgi:hypothetical protein